MTKKRYLFIDAYNVIHSLSELHRALDKSLDCARDQLAERVTSIHDAQDIHTVLILDSRSDSLEIEHPFGKETFEFVYTPAWLSVESTVEQLLARVCKPARMTVASNDALVRESARVNGAVAISAKDLLDWICACEQRLFQDVERRRRLSEENWLPVAKFGQQTRINEKVHESVYSFSK